MTDKEIPKGYCNRKLCPTALVIINRQQDEIERLQEDSKRLKKVQMQLDDAMKMYSTIKAEAIKEFAKKLKECEYKEEYEDHLCYMVDNLVKEMVGEGK